MRGQPEERRNEQSGDEFDEEFGDGSELVDVEARRKYAASNLERKRGAKMTGMRRMYAAATLPRVRPVPPPPPPPVASSHQQPPVNSRPRQQQPQQQQQQVQRTGSKGRRLIPVSSLREPLSISAQYLSMEIEQLTPLVLLQLIGTEHCSSESPSATCNLLCFL